MSGTEKKFLSDVRQALVQLRDLMGDSYPIVLDAFLTDTPNRLERMMQSARDHDLQEVANEAHALKGSSGNIGASAMASLCNKISTDIHEGNLPEPESRVQAVIDIYRDIEKVIQEEQRSFE